MEKIILGLLSQAYKSDEETNGKIAELLKEGKNDEVLTILLDKDKQRITSIQEEGKMTFKDAYKKATSEVMKDFETKLKTQYGIESDKLGIDLVSEIISKQQGGEKDITENDILKHPYYTKLIEKHSTEKAEIRKELEDFKKGINSEKMFDTISSKILGLRQKGGFVIPAEEAIANKLQSNLFRDLKDYDFETQEDGNIIITQKGEVVKDGHGNRVSFDDFASGLLNSYYVTQKNNGGGNSGSGNEDGEGKDVKKFNTREELMTYYNNSEVSVEDRLSALEANKHLVD